MDNQFTKEEKVKMIRKVKEWWHTIDLGDGIKTPGFISERVHNIRASAIPENLNGKRVLDIGAWDGYYSFECEKRGASVLAIDNNQHGRGHEGFYVAKEILGSRVEFKVMDLFDLSHLDEEFDVVLFFGVLYHLRHPLRGLEIIADKTKELLILESHYIRTFTSNPIMKFHPGADFKGDPTNWWSPNITCIHDLLGAAGFSSVETVRRYHTLIKRGRVIMKAYK